MKSNSGGKAVRYNKWGYIFLIPFIVVFVIFQLVPLVNTIYNSFFENYMSGLTQVGPRFVGLDNYKALFSSGDIWTYFKNTMVLWIMCFIPQIFLSLLLGAWFSDVRLKLKGSRFFKTVIYLPNLIMASAFSMLFFTLFSDGGPINSLLMQIGFISEPYKFLSHAGSARGLIAMISYVFQNSLNSRIELRYIEVRTLNEFLPFFLCRILYYLHSNLSFIYSSFASKPHTP